jgi:uncharacterized lipoprotein
MLQLLICAIYCNKGKAIVKLFGYFSFLLSLLIAGCAHSPQQLSLQPEIGLVGERYGQGQLINVSARDDRADKLLGNLGGAYPNSSVISLSGEVESVLARAAQAHLAAQGFNVHGGQEGAASLVVVLEQLQYMLPKQVLGKTVSLQAVMSIEAAFQNDSYQGRYKTKSEQLMVLTPSQQKNQQLVNAVISETLERAFADPKLQAFLSNL